MVECECTVGDVEDLRQELAVEIKIRYGIGEFLNFLYEISLEKVYKSFNLTKSKLERDWFEYLFSFEEVMS